MIKIVRNKLESKFSESGHADKSLWFMKLISNPLTHQTTPADYILDYHNSTGLLVMCLVECKQVTCPGRLAFNRLRQLHDLINFENIRPIHHKSFFCIAFWDKRWDQSEVYLIPVHVMQRLIMTLQEKGILSLNRQYAKDVLSAYRMPLENGLLLFKK